jgi:hypothetical protein
MTPLHPVTKASLSLAIDLAKAVAAGNPDYYATVAPAYLALRIREILRFCEECDIWEPADHSLIVLAMFRPAPECLPPVDRDYALRTLMNTGTTPEARARTVALALGGTLPPGAAPYKSPRA